MRFQYFIKIFQNSIIRQEIFFNQVKTLYNETPLTLKLSFLTLKESMILTVPESLIFLECDPEIYLNLKNKRSHHEPAYHDHRGKIG